VCCELQIFWEPVYIPVYGALHVTSAQNLLRSGLTGGSLQAGVRIPQELAVACDLFSSAAMSHLGTSDQEELLPRLLGLLEQVTSQVRGTGSRRSPGECRPGLGADGPGAARPGLTGPPEGSAWSCAATVTSSALSVLRAGVQAPEEALHVDRLLDLALWESWDRASDAAAVAAAAALIKWSPGTIPAGRLTHPRLCLPKRRVKDVYGIVGVHGVYTTPHCVFPFFPVFGTGRLIAKYQLDGCSYGSRAVRPVLVAREAVRFCLILWL
jgi:hypothetical protein